MKNKWARVIPQALIQQAAHPLQNQTINQRRGLSVQVFSSRDCASPLLLSGSLRDPASNPGEEEMVVCMSCPPPSPKLSTIGDQVGKVTPTSCSCLALHTWHPWKVLTEKSEGYDWLLAQVGHIHPYPTVVRYPQSPASPFNSLSPRVHQSLTTKFTSQLYLLSNIEDLQAWRLVPSGRHWLIKCDGGYSPLIFTKNGLCNPSVCVQEAGYPPIVHLSPESRQGGSLPPLKNTK